MKVVWLNRPDLILPPDISLNFLKCPFDILFIFKILMQGTQIVFEFHMSFQKIQEYKLLNSFPLLDEFFCGFCVLFFLPIGWINILEFSYNFWKRGDHSIGFWKVRWALYWSLKSFISIQGHFSKEKRGPLAFFESLKG